MIYLDDKFDVKEMRWCEDGVEINVDLNDQIHRIKICKAEETVILGEDPEVIYTVLVDGKTIIKYENKYGLYISNNKGSIFARDYELDGHRYVFFKSSESTQINKINKRVLTDKIYLISTVNSSKGCINPPTQAIGNMKPKFGIPDSGSIRRGRLNYVKMCKDDLGKYRDYVSAMTWYRPNTRYCVHTMINGIKHLKNKNKWTIKPYYGKRPLDESSYIRGAEIALSNMADEQFGIYVVDDYNNIIRYCTRKCLALRHSVTGNYVCDWNDEFYSYIDAEKYHLIVTHESYYLELNNELLDSKIYG